ncbi:PRC-barrel domain-containing protein [Microvirga sp. 2MCAF38]|uniref:PRC-barrel domain-containing protein n=1 Tax=Microvirga sp. 2MCAF38 TaxID=3232989 RepID=UPI003F9744D6
MRRFFITLAAASILSGAAIAQETSTTGAIPPSFVAVKPDSMLSYNLVGLDVSNPGNETVGEIKDLVLDQGRLAGYIVSVGGFLGMGDHYVVVDPAAVRVSYNASDSKWHAMMNTTKEQLKAAPEFKYEGKWKR